MRILFFSSPLYGHVIPQISLARAFRDRGDDVAFVTNEALAPFFAAEHLGFLPAGPGAQGVMAEMVRRTGIDPVAAGWTGSAETAAEMFAGVRVDLGYYESVDRTRAFKPDLIVAEAFDFVGPVVAEQLCMPHATVAFGPALPPEFTEIFVERVTRTCADRGLSYRPGDWYLDPCPLSLQLEGWQAPTGRLALRPEAFSAGPEAQATDSAGERAGRTRVLVTFGTLFNETGFISSLLTELLARDYDLRVTLGLAASEADFSVHDERIEYAAFTPLARLLDGVDVVLTVGGAGTVLGALSRGVPLVLTPQGADQPLNAARVAGAGAGIALPPGPVAPEAVARAVEEVLAKPDYRRGAREIAAEIRAMPSAQEVAARLAAEVIQGA
jgi:UDP:flavonoid glycosyltransferase YjiC (YdhE family)